MASLLPRLLELPSRGALSSPLPESCSLDPIPFALQPSVGQVARVDVSSKVEVVWADNSKTIILPQVRPCQNSDRLVHSCGSWAGSHGPSLVPAQGMGKTGSRIFLARESYF